MKIYKSALFDDFRCIAGACTDSCCKEWSVTVDPEAAEMYRNLPGDLGDRLCQVLAEEDGDTIMVIEDGRCPMWRQDGLCRIQAQLGHDALCKTCREFPRLTHDYGDFVELGLELSCPEAARMILSSPIEPAVVVDAPGGEEPDYDSWDMDILQRTRQEALDILKLDRPVNEILAIILMYGYHAQSLLDGADGLTFDVDAALEEAKNFAKPADSVDILDFFKDLEILGQEWKDRLDDPKFGAWDAKHLPLAGYFLDRYWLQAISDFDLVGRVKFALISCLAVKILGGDLTQTAQRYSKEIENDPDNVDALLDGAYTAQAFTDDKLLGHLLSDQ